MHLTLDYWAEEIVGRNMATFTALNGGEPKGTERHSSSPTSIHAVSEDHPTRQILVQDPKVRDVSTGQREHWSRTSPDRPSYQPAVYPEVEGAHKRKRSPSDETLGELRRKSALARDREQQPHTPHTESRDPYSSSQREREYRQYNEENRGHHEVWYAQQGNSDDRASYDPQGSTSLIASPTDEQIGDTLRRANAHMENQHDYQATSPDGDDSSVIYGSASYTPEQRKGDSMIQSDPKKRKRNFSNRTKTG